MSFKIIVKHNCFKNGNIFSAMIVLKCHCTSFIFTPLPPPTPNPLKNKTTCCFLPCCAHLQKILSCDHSQSSHATTQDIVRICFQVHGATLTSGLKCPFFCFRKYTLQNYKTCFFVWRETVRCIRKYHKTTSVPIRREEKCYKRRTAGFWAKRGTLQGEWLVCPIPVQMRWQLPTNARRSSIWHPT